MQIHQLKPRTNLKRERRVGRGGKRGTTSGRGTKGQKARAGAKVRPALRDVIKKLPKRRGYRFRPRRIREPVVLNLDAIAKRFSNGEMITPAALLARGLVSKIRGRIPPVKILGRGDIGLKNLVFKDITLSKSAAAKTKRALL